MSRACPEICVNPFIGYRASVSALAPSDPLNERNHRAYAVVYKKWYCIYLVRSLCLHFSDKHGHGERRRDAPRREPASDSSLPCILDFSSLKGSYYSLVVYTPLKRDGDWSGIGLLHAQDFAPGLEKHSATVLPKLR